MLPKAILFCLLSMVSTTTVWAQTKPVEPAAAPAVENPSSANLKFRGQGLANMCYAFAEEQMLKDISCKDDCQLNANIWKFSVFDIAMAHQLRWRKDNPQTKEGHRVGESIANGSSAAFPYAEVGISEVRASSCTLERELFYFNRSKVTNPDRLELSYFIRRLYDDLKSGKKNPTFESSELRSSWNALREISKTSKDRDDFLTKTVAYSKCSEKVQIPRLSVRSETLKDLEEINSLVRQLLSQQKSLYVGICAEVLKYEKVDPSPCRRHAVILKDIRKSECAQGTCKDEILVVDSAFFSQRTRNQDGSSWVPASVVTQAIGKSASDFEQIIKKASLAMDASASAKLAARSTIDDIKKLLAQAPLVDLKTQVVGFFQQYVQQIGGGDKELESKLLAQFDQINIQSPNDIEQAMPAFEQLFVFALKKQSSQTLNLTGNGIVWVE